MISIIINYLLLICPGAIKYHYSLGIKVPVLGKEGGRYPQVERIHQKHVCETCPTNTIHIVVEIRSTITAQQTLETGNSQYLT